MIDQDLMNVLNTTLAELCAKSGVPNPPAFQETGWGWCEVIFPHDVSVRHWETLNGFVKAFRKIKGVDSANGTGIVCKKNDDCEYSIEVSADENLYEMSEEEKREEEEDELFEAGDPVIVAKREAEERAAHEAEMAERRKHYKEYLLPIPPPSVSAPTELYLTMAYEPYDQIVSGEKVTEFRAYCETWVKRILANIKTLKTIKFQRGYGGPGRPKPAQMIWSIKNIDLYDIETRESCDPFNVKEGFVPTHIAIDLGERLDDSAQEHGLLTKPTKCKIVSTSQKTFNNEEKHGMKYKVIVADITKQQVDAIVNAANEACLGGGGVDGAIHHAAGPALKQACFRIPEVSPGVRCPTGKAVITDAGNLPCKKVIHTVGPNCYSVTDESEQDRLLASAYLSSLELAKKNRLLSIAFPSISTGIFGFPIGRAAKIVAKTVSDFLAHEPDMSVTMCIYDPNPKTQAKLIKAYTDAFTEESSISPEMEHPAMVCRNTTCKDKATGGFPEILTAEMLANFKQTDNGATHPHHGWIDGVHYIAKCKKYMKENPSVTPSDDHVHNEYLADCFLREAGLRVPASREYRVDFHNGDGPQIVRLAKFIENTTPLYDAFQKSSCKGAFTAQILLAYPVLSFVSAIDTFNNDNALVDADGGIWYVDNGADFDYRALGKRKGWWFDRSNVDDPNTGYLALRNFPGAVQLQTMLGVPDETLWSVAARYDFVALANKLPEELVCGSVMRYAEKLNCRAAKEA